MNEGKPGEIARDNQYEDSFYPKKRRFLTQGRKPRGAFSFSRHGFAHFLWQGHRLAETEGFEPSVPNYQYDGLANRWFQPLTHVSCALGIGGL